MYRYVWNTKVNLVCTAVDLRFDHDEILVQNFSANIDISKVFFL